ncbi:MAG: DUF2232 domain-containing protein, partial [Pseudomonadota bacterium]
LLKRKIGFNNVLFFSSFVILGTYVIAAAIYCSINSVDLVTALSTKIDLFLTTMSSLYPEAIKQALMDSGLTQKELAQSLAVKIPAAAAVSVIVFLFINLIIATRFDYISASYLANENLKKVKLSEWFILAALLLGAFYIYTDYTSLNHSVLLSMASAFLFKSLMMVYFFHGLIIMHVFLTEKMQEGFLRLLIFSAIVVFAYVVVAAVGFFDTWFDFRKYLKNKKQGE